MTSLICLPDPLWGSRTKDYEGTPLRCPSCGSLDMYYSAHPDDPEEIFTDTVRCKNCGFITDWYEAYRQGVDYQLLSHKESSL